MQKISLIYPKESILIFDENEVSGGELYREILLGKLSINEGMFYENAIAQMLVAAGHKLYRLPGSTRVSASAPIDMCLILK